KGYHVLKYDITDTLDRQTDSIWGHVTMTAQSTSALSDIIQFQKYLTIDSIRPHNVATHAPFVTTDTTTGEYHVHLSKTDERGTYFSITTYYHGHCKPEEYSGPGGQWG